jgi:SNF2 family DNA or RNA helicase
MLINMIANTIEERLLIFKKYLDRTKMEHKQYQYDGVEWCLNNELGSLPVCNVRGRGGIVADEMGLGKTIMMIGLCCANIMPKTLIVLPPILIEQWYLQIYRTTGHRALIYYGEDKKHTTLEKLNSDKVSIVITSYAHISVSKKQMKAGLFSLLHQVKWNRIIFDEAHHLRNSNTRGYIGAKMLRSDIRWLVSGTPVQNNKKDFYNLCSLLGLPASFYTNIDNLIKYAGSFILKRTKKKVGIEMPDVVVNKEIVKWKNNMEMALAQDIHAGLEFSNVTDKSGGRFDDHHKLVLMMKAKQSCILPSLILKKLDGFNPYKDATGSTSKLDSVIENILQNKDNGNGKLIFCQFREEIDEIAKRLREGGIANVVTMDGRTTNAKRKKILENKNDAIILQIQTGCEGLNLQENYNEVYFISPHWNPAVEDQAVARCHRIGQLKPVFVKRFEMCKFDDLEKDTVTIDKYVNHVQENKRNIANQYM